MSSSHFADDEALNEFLASPRRDRALLNHVRYCELCQRRARAQRLTRLQRFGTDCESGHGHVPPQTLLAFCTDRLNDGQTMQMMHHLNRCQVCRDAFAKLHRQLNERGMGGS